MFKLFSEINSNVLFCRHCGQSIKGTNNNNPAQAKNEKCVICNYEISSEANFCLNCGQKLNINKKCNFSPGIKIVHETFGSGIIKTSRPMEAFKLDVKFDNGREETVSSTHVQVKSKKKEIRKFKRKTED